jgi:hypothetical protein
MRVAIARPRFDWSSLEDSPSLASLRELLASIPDGKLLDGLRQHRGRGRDDYPVAALWGVVLLTVLLRHKDFESCLAELRRNQGWRRLIGIDDENRVPKKWNVSRFLAVLGGEPHRAQLVEIFDQMARRLGKVVPGLGQHLAGDATALRAQKKRDAAERRYKGRTAIERVNGRLKVFWGADDGNIVGARRFHAFVGVLMIAHLAFATQLAATPRREGTLGKMRLSPIAKKLRRVMQQ